jgi:RNA polymerase sigma factor (TIGR02999 family)
MAIHSAGLLSIGSRMTHPDAGAGEVTRLLAAARAGDAGALERLVPLVYAELHARAERALRLEAPGHTLAPTDLVHEAYLRLAGGRLPAGDRHQFLGIAARVMRQVLVDHARRRLASKRGGEWVRTTLGEGPARWGLDPAELLALDDALAGLEPRQREVVELRFFAGLDEREIAGALGLTERTVRRDWVKARAWLYRALYGDAEEPAT